MRSWGSQWNKQSMDYLLKLGSNSSLERYVGEICTGNCLVLGAGSETNLVARYSDAIVGINICREELLRIGGRRTELIIADAHWLPFREASFDAIVSRSVLHHLSIYVAMKELRQVLRKGGNVILYEPGLLNPLAFFGRQFFPTDRHVASEQPFIPSSLKKVIFSFEFKIIKEEYYYLFVHFFPIIAKWVAFFKKSDILKLSYRFDALLCRTFLKNLCWILILVLKK